MKQTGIFDIDKSIPIVFAYGLLKPDRNDYHILEVGVSAGNIIENEIFRGKDFISDMKAYKSSRQEWEVENIKEIEDRYYYKDLDYPEIYKINKGQQVQFTETQTPKDGKRGKCKIVKIL